MLSENQIAAAWRSSFARLDCDDAQLEPLLATLTKAYAKGERHYHTLDHVIHCLDTLASYPGKLQFRAELEIALWYHDAIYDPKRNDNEEQSAILLETELSKAGFNEMFIRKAQSLVRATDHKAPANDETEAIIADVDMAILATNDEHYRTYSKQIRKEYSCFDNSAYRQGRSKFLKHFLALPQIYQTAHFHQRLEIPARVNLECELRSLEETE